MQANGFLKWLRNESGVSAIVFALALPVLVAGAGIAVDLGQAYNVKNRLGNALDKAALAVASSSGTEEELTERMNAFLEANYPDSKIGQMTDVALELDEHTVSITGHARVNTTFMRVFGFDYMTVGAYTEVTREVRGLEVVMVLDNTGSMSTNNNIATLRTAAASFVNILFDAVNDPEDIKIGMAPYASSVRVGRYGLGQNPDGSVYGDGTSFVTLPPGVSYTTNKNSSTGWFGCVVEHKSENYDPAATHVNNSYGQLWKTAASCTTASNCRGHGWDASATNNDPAPNDIPDNYTGPWDIYMYGTVTRNCSGTCNPKYTFNKDSMPNRYCPNAPILPLTSDRNALLSNISLMQADGATLSNTGLAWGYRLLSPDPPFTEGSEWGDIDWDKAILFMTDGETSMGGNFTSYWFTNKNDIDNSSLDDRLGEICDALKENGVLIYTVTFAAGVPDETKAAYRACATSEDTYYDAPSQSDLVAAFEGIARQLANLHISR